MADTGIEREIQVEDDRTGMSPKTLERALLDHLTYTQSKDLHSATLLDVNFALAHTVRDRLVRRWMKTQRTYQERDPKRVYYLSAEFLLGRFLGNNLLNLGVYELAERGLAKYGIELAAVLGEERDPGLGNGGLGRLAACFLDSMATLELPGYGYGIRYEFGIFDQAIVDGRQVEHPDDWLEYGNPWEIPAPRVRRRGAVRRARRGGTRRDGYLCALGGRQPGVRRALRLSDRRPRQQHGQHPAALGGPGQPRVRSRGLQRR